MKRKVFALLMGAAMTVSLLAGCGATGQTETAAPAAESTAAEPAEAETTVESTEEPADESAAADTESVAETAEEVEGTAGTGCMDRHERLYGKGTPGNAAWHRDQRCG